MYTAERMKRGIESRDNSRVCTRNWTRTKNED